MILKDGFPYSNVWFKEESVISNNLTIDISNSAKKGGQIIVVDGTVEH